MAAPDPVDTIGPWTIKAVATRTRDTVTNAARREGLTVGQWLERKVAEWEAAGSPVPVSALDPTTALATPADLAQLAQLMDATRAFADSAGVAVPAQLAKDGLSMMRMALRRAKGLPPSIARRKPLAAIADASQPNGLDARGGPDPT